jgi:hypothetical protein
VCPAFPACFTVMLLAGFFTAAAEEIILLFDKSLCPPPLVTLKELEIPVGNPLI